MSNLSERDICTKYITPALINAGWDNQKQIREQASYQLEFRDRKE